MIVNNACDFTPLQNVDGLWLKREDLFLPFGENGVNGGKLRQCYMLVEEIKDKYNGIITCCSIHIPQGAIAAAVAKHFGLPCVIYYGATNEKRLEELPMPKIAKSYGAELVIASKSGRHNILYSKAREYATNNNYFVVEFGFNIIEYSKLMFGAISKQVQNIPDNLENIVITCGSGITTIGIILGIYKYKKNIKNIHLVGTAPVREDFIQRILSEYGINDCKLNYHDLFHRKGFAYEKGVEAIYHDITFHPQYEAKAFKWLVEESDINIHDNSCLLWVVGAKPLYGCNE